MITITAGTILGIIAIVLTIAAAGCTFAKEILDGRDSLGEELAKNTKRCAAKKARKQWEKTIIKSNGKKYRIRKK